MQHSSISVAIYLGEFLRVTVAEQARQCRLRYDPRHRPLRRLDG